ncbi:nucleotidyltransferase domain-containing protein [Candidatus Margulisiibacteriota bacterium]
MLSQEQIKTIVNEIKVNVNPKKIYLFGSYANGQPTEKSDLDLLVIDDSGKDKNKLALQISKSLFPRNYGLDLIVSSPEEIKKKQEKKMSFWVDIATKGKTLYERS